MKTKKKQNENPEDISVCVSTPHTVHPILKTYFGYCFSKAALKYKAILNAELEVHGITSPQLGILKLLHVLGPVSQITLGQDMGIDKASMVKFIDGLEKKKWVQRIVDAKDRRIKLVGVTAKGADALKKLTVLHLKVAKEFLSPLNKSEQEQLQALLSRLT
jgi:DNA-binding MarR family transcriptional regulator